MQGNASPKIGVTSGYTVSSKIESFPKSTEISGTSYSFTANKPGVITVTGWPLSAQETINQFGQHFWLLDNKNGCLAYGNWTITGSGPTYTLIFASQSGFPHFTADLSSGEAFAIPNRVAKNFDQCSVKCLSNGGVFVNGVQLTATNQVITIQRQGNSNFPVIIDASSGQAQVTTGLYTN